MSSLLLFGHTATYTPGQYGFHEEIRDLPPAWNPYIFIPSMPESRWNVKSRHNTRLPEYHCAWCREEVPRTNHMGACNSCRTIKCICCGANVKRDFTFPLLLERWKETHSLNETTDVCSMCKPDVVDALTVHNIEPISLIITCYLEQSSEHHLAFIADIFK